MQREIPMGDTLKIEEMINDKDLVIFKLTGRLSKDTWKEFKARIDNLKDVKNGIVIDFADVDYLSAFGLNLLYKLDIMTRAFNKKLKIVNVNQEIYDIFVVTGFTEILDIQLKEDI